MKTTEDVQEAVKPLLEQVKRVSFVDGYKATDDEAMGIMMSKFFEWDGLQIMRAFYHALEDANYHTENLTIERMITRLEERAQVQK